MIFAVNNVQKDLGETLILEIRNELRAATPPKEFDPSAFAKTWEMLINQNMGAIWATKQGKEITGATGAIVSVEPVEGFLVVAQAFMFLRTPRDPLDALALLNEVENYGANRGARRSVASVCYDTMGGKQAEFLARRGYGLYETRYYKNLIWEQKP